LTGAFTIRPAASAQTNNPKENTPVEYPSSPEYQHDTNNPIHMILAHLTARLNEQSQTIAEIRTDLGTVKVRLDEAQHMTSDEYGAQVVQQIMAAMPTIQQQALKAAKRGGRR